MCGIHHSDGTVFFIFIVAFGVVIVHCSLSSFAIIYRRLISLRKPHWSLKQQICRTFILFSISFFFFLVFSSTCIHLYNFWYSYSGELLMFVSVTLHSMEFWSHRPPVFRFFFLNEYQSTWNFHLFSAPFQSKAEKTKNKNIK